MSKSRPAKNKSGIRDYTETHMNKKLIQAIGAGVTATTLSAFAGDMAVTPPAPVNNGNWCDALQGIGTIYKDKNNPYIQEIKVFGRTHYQFSSTDGEYNGTDFDSNGGELRRLRFGTSIKFLNDFKLVGRVNLESGGYRTDKLEFANFDELYLTYNVGDLGAFEDVSFTYGRLKLAFGGEEHMSSKKIKTVERSNINNTYGGPRPTGLMANAGLGGVNYSVGIFNTDSGRDGLGDWNEGIAYYASAAFEVSSGDVIADFLYNDANVPNDQDVFGYEWAASLTYMTEIGNFDLLLNATYGEDHGGDSSYGLVIMPSTFLIEDKLEAVVRYQYAGSNDGNGLRINSRAVRNSFRDDTGAGVAGGDENHTIYAGLNYFLCDHNAKVMVGAEHETLDGTGVD
ncbi:OprO/OprP family phosphate-selective porin, partial [Akkermansiaceae bacterium]|nr:OprO/OprP family phosphate-selective porin [Akkermansiaceae bacterium]